MAGSLTIILKDAQTLTVIPGMSAYALGGVGIPAGGVGGQVLSKLGPLDYDAEWQTVSGVTPPSATHTQVTPAITWSVTHNLGFNPAVTILDSGGTLVEGALVFNTINTLTITLSSAISGIAYMS